MHSRLDMAPRRGPLVATDLRCAHAGPISLRVDPGECVAVTGPSGAGKSVVLRMLADLVVHQGQVTLGGRCMTGMSGSDWRRRVRYAAAEPGWWAPLLGDHLQGPVPDALLRTLCLTPDILTRPVDAASTGQRQRIAFLREIEDTPDVLLLDEPCSALDPQATAGIERILRERMADGLAVVLVSHDAAQVGRLATRTVAL